MNLRAEKVVAGVVALAVTGLLVVCASTMRNQGMIGSARAADLPAPVGVAAATGEATARSETVVFAGGCFWGVQGVFQHVKGVQSAVSGYIGGAAGTARYDLVSSGRTGHAEAVQITYDPKQVSYAQLMQIFFSVIHNPTQLNYQGPDRGTQYRSAVFTTTTGQRHATASYIAQLEKAEVFEAPIVTQVEAAKPFFAAERYHQDYLTLHPRDAYIRYHDAPKLAALKASYPALYRVKPMLVTQP